MVYVRSYAGDRPQKDAPGETPFLLNDITAYYNVMSATV